MVSDSPARPAGTLACSPYAVPARSAPLPDTRRWLQLTLAAFWLLDGVLQVQGFMFSRGFSRMLAATAAGNPAVIARPIGWVSTLIGHHPVATNAAFAGLQILIGFAIASRLTVRIGLAVSIGWALAVWWLGEGLGGILSGHASPVNGAPGPVLCYALLAVLLWPRTGWDEARRAPFVAAAAVGGTAARVIWILLWGSLAYFAVTPANRAAQGLHDMVGGMARGEPGWLAAINHSTARVLDHRGLAVSIVLAAALAAIGVAVLLPAPIVRAAVVLAVIVALAIWVAGQDLGEIMTGSATDPGSGPLLALIAVAYWPAVRRESELLA